REPAEGATTEREARNFLAVRLGQVQTGTAPKTEEKSLRYGDLREDILRDFRVRKLKSLDTLSDGTESIKGLTKLDEYFGYTATNRGMKVSEYSNAKWEENFIQARRCEGVSDATIANSAKLLRQMFNLAVENGRLNVSPKVTIPKAPEARETVLHKEQFDQL